MKSFFSKTACCAAIGLSMFLSGFTTANAASPWTRTSTEQMPGQYLASPSAVRNPASLNGMVSSPHYLGTQAGIEVLRNGGNAVDAAIAIGATLGVVYPHMTGIGGDNFWIIYNAKTGEVRALNASGRAGSKATIDYFKSMGATKSIPWHGYLACNTVPGTISGWEAAYKYAKESFNNKGLKWKDLFTTAISYAENGFPVGSSLELWLYNSTNPNDKEPYNLQRFSGFRETYLKPDGRPYVFGEIMRLPDLAETLKLVAKKGADAFYKGPIAKKISEELLANGGVLTEDDFKNHKANWVTPLSVQYRDGIVYNLPPNTQGMASLAILNILNNFDVASLGDNTADYFHLLAEATKEAFIDRDTYLTDPEFSPIPTDRLLSKEHGMRQAARINMKKASKNLAPLDPKGDTTYFCVVDKDGNAVSIIQSIYFDFGSGIVPKGTGVLLQNRGCFFSLDPKHVNHIEPGKRTFHTLNAAMMLKNGKPYLVYGTQGGEGQPQTHAAMVTRIVDFGLMPQDAIAGPRYLYGRMVGTANNDLKLEGRVPQEVLNELKRRGHTVVKVEDFTELMGQAGCILIDQRTNIKYGGTDLRGDGLATGY